MGCTDSRENDDVFADIGAPSPITPRRIKDKAYASSSEGHVLRSALVPSERGLCDLKVTWEQGGTGSVDDLFNSEIDSIIGEYYEAGMHNQKKCYKNRNGWIHLYWHDGSFGRIGWWFGEEIDGFSGLAWNCGAGRNDSEEVPETGWNTQNGFFESPQKVRIRVAPPSPPITVVPSPPTRSFSLTRSDNGGSSLSCFPCWDDILAKLSGGGPRRPAAPWAPKSIEEKPKTPQMEAAPTLHSSAQARITRTLSDHSLAIQEHASRIQEHASTVKTKTALALQEHTARVKAKTAEIHGKALGLHGKALERYRDAVTNAPERYKRLRSQSQEAFDKHYPLVKANTMDLYDQAKRSNVAHAALACCDCIPAAGSQIEYNIPKPAAAATSQSSKADWRAQGANDWNFKVAGQVKEERVAQDRAAEADDAQAADPGPVAAKISESARSTSEADQAAGVATRGATRAEVKRISQVVEEHRQEVAAEQAAAENERLAKQAAAAAAFEAAAEAEEAKRQKLVRQMADNEWWANQERLAREAAAERATAAAAAAAAREADEATKRKVEMELQQKVERLAQEAARRNEEESFAREATDDAARELAEAKLMEEEFLAREAAEASESARSQQPLLKKTNTVDESFQSPRPEAKSRQLESLSPMDKSEFQRRKEVFNSPRQ